jgi:hypothetical protein
VLVIRFFLFVLLLGCPGALLCCARPRPNRQRPAAAAPLTLTVWHFSSPLPPPPSILELTLA